LLVFSFLVVCIENMFNTEKKQKDRKNIRLAILAGFFLLALFFAAVFKGNADNSISQISQSSTADTQDKLDELNARAAVYRQIIDIKRKQSETLGNKISSMESNIQEVKSQIADTENQIDSLNSQIQKLEDQIKEKEALIDSQKQMLSQLIQAYYQISQTSPVAIYLAEDNITSFMLNKDRVSQTGDKIREMIEKMNDLKAQIQQQSDELAKKG
jgi:septal ring factor EnvC (AmiA/AmiB activator)